MQFDNIEYFAKQLRYGVHALAYVVIKRVIAHARN